MNELDKARIKDIRERYNLDKTKTLRKAGRDSGVTYDLLFLVELCDRMDRGNGCPICGGAVRKQHLSYEFEHGIGANATMLECTSPVYFCLNCEFEYTDYEGEKAQEEAVRKHLEGLREQP